MNQRPVSPTLYRALVDVIAALHRIEAGVIPQRLSANCGRVGDTQSVKFICTSFSLGLESDDEKTTH